MIFQLNNLHFAIQSCPCCVHVIHAETVTTHQQRLSQKLCNPKARIGTHFICRKVSQLKPCLFKYIEVLSVHYCFILNITESMHREAKLWFFLVQETSIIKKGPLKSLNNSEHGSHLNSTWGRVFIISLSAFGLTNQEICISVIFSSNYWTPFAGLLLLTQLKQIRHTGFCIT